VTFLGSVIVLAGLLWLFWLVWRNPPKNWHFKDGALPTLLQVVPATVVAVFIFAVGAVFIIVQIISPTLGSRAIEDLLARRRARICVIAGLVLLLACLTLAALTLIKQEEASELWEASWGSALALATLIYVPLSIWCISSIFHDFVSPDAYSALRSRWRGRSRPLASEWAFSQLRALRQWLRTACGTGESRDIVFALAGFQELLRSYCANARSEDGRSLNEKLRGKPPDEYARTDKIVNSRWREYLDPAIIPAEPKGWFGDEFGRALARCAEVGIQSGTLLRRDLDRILVTLGGATLQLAGLVQPGEEDKGPPPRLPLPEEIEFLLDRIAEIGMYAVQIDNKAYSDWFERPALLLASLEEKLEGVHVQETGPPLPGGSPAHDGQPNEPTRSLAARSLAAWCLVNYTIQQSGDGAAAQGMPTARGRSRLGRQAETSPELWNEAKRLALTPAMHPAWMPFADDEPDAQQRLSTFLDDVQTLIASDSRPENMTFADGLDNWIIGGSFQASATGEHGHVCCAITADRAATLRSTVPGPNADAFVGQGVSAGGYRGTQVTFRGEVRAEDVTGRAELRLRIFTRDRGHSVEKCGPAIAVSCDWTSHELTAWVPGDAELIRFSLTLTGPGQVALRNPELTPARVPTASWQRPSPQVHP
jgi:hypothetical protein